MITQGPRFEWWQAVEGGAPTPAPAPAPALAQVPAERSEAQPAAEGKAAEVKAPEGAKKTEGKVRWRFRLVAEKNDKVLRSEAYNSLEGCMNGIQSVKANAGVEHRYERKKNGNTYSFNLVAPNGKVVGTGETSATERKREDNIAAVKRIAPSALVHEVPK